MRKRKEIIKAVGTVIISAAVAYGTLGIGNIILTITSGIGIAFMMNTGMVGSRNVIKEKKKHGRNDKYTAEQLIKDMMVEIQKYSEELTILFPKRLFVEAKFDYRYDDASYSANMLSKFWGYAESYVRDLFTKDNKKEDFKISNKALSKLRQKIHDKLGERGFTCLEILDEYENSELNLKEFVLSMRFELARVSGEIALAQGEASEILGFSVVDKVYYIKNRYRNYKFSLFVLNDMIERIEQIFGKKAKNCYELIQKYKDLNKDLKEYAQEKHNVEKSHYFKTILSGELEKAYMYGFICHDGYVTAQNFVGIKVNPKDKVIIDKLIHLIGLDTTEVKVQEETTIQIYKGERKEYKSLKIVFGCKPMAEDLNNLGGIGCSLPNKEVAPVIKDLIKKAKQKSLNDWMDTIEGKTALAWLLGAYDADGFFAGGYTGTFYSSYKSYLNKIKELFEIDAEVNDVREAGWYNVLGRMCFCRSTYRLSMSSKNVMIKMMEAYPRSFERKRPVKFRLTSNSLDNYLG